MASLLATVKPMMKALEHNSLLNEKVVSSAADEPAKSPQLSAVKCVSYLSSAR